MLTSAFGSASSTYFKIVFATMKKIQAEILV